MPADDPLDRAGETSSPFSGPVGTIPPSPNPPDRLVGAEVHRRESSDHALRQYRIAPESVQPPGDPFEAVVAGHPQLRQSKPFKSRGTVYRRRVFSRFTLLKLLEIRHHQFTNADDRRALEIAVRRNSIWQRLPSARTGCRGPAGARRPSNWGSC